MDKRIVITVASLLALLLGFLIYRLIFSGEKKIKAVYILEGIRNDKTVVDSNITFIDRTPEAKTWSWDFGDGEMASGQRVNHSYVNPGNYKIVLVVNTENGIAIDSTSKTIRVAPAIEQLNNNIRVTYTVSEWKSKVGTKIKFANTTEKATEAIWDFGDGNTALGLVTEHSYSNVGYYKVRLKVKGDFGIAKDTGTIVTIIDNTTLPPVGAAPKPVQPKKSPGKKNGSIRLEGPGEIKEIKEVEVK
jgi:PKD repeat protein